MKKIYLVYYYDSDDNTRGVICASETERISGKAADSVKDWLNCFERFSEEDVADAVSHLSTKEVTYIGEFELLVEETFLYS